MIEPSAIMKEIANFYNYGFNYYAVQASVVIKVENDPVFLKTQERSCTEFVWHNHCTLIWFSAVLFPTTTVTRQENYCLWPRSGLFRWQLP